MTDRYVIHVVELLTFLTSQQIFHSITNKHATSIIDITRYPQKSRFNRICSSLIGLIYVFKTLKALLILPFHSSFASLTILLLCCSDSYFFISLVNSFNFSSLCASSSLFLINSFSFFPFVEDISFNPFFASSISIDSLVFSSFNCWICLL